MLFFCALCCMLYVEVPIETKKKGAIAMTKKIYSSEYEDIIGQFEMSDKPNDEFNPKEDTFKNLVKYALKKSFPDFNFRTLTETNEGKADYKEWKSVKKAEKKRLPKEERKNFEEPTKTLYLMNRLEDNGFIERYVEYFRNPCVKKDADFDKWHHETCQLFLEILNGRCNGLGKGVKIYKNLCYGKAQKIVNMMFKHLYCLKVDEAYQKYFTHCHMTLDNFTLEWFKRFVCCQRTGSWSNLVYEDNPNAISNNSKCYQYYQSKTRKYFEKSEVKEKYGGMTPFQAEFFIWPEIQLHMAAEAFLFEMDPDTYKGQQSKEEILTMPMNKLISEVEHAIDKYNRNLLKIVG